MTKLSFKNLSTARRSFAFIVVSSRNETGPRGQFRLKIANASLPTAWTCAGPWSLTKIMTLKPRNLRMVGIAQVYSHISRYTSARAYGDATTRSTGTCVNPTASYNRSAGVSAWLVSRYSRVAPAARAAAITASI
jgi:hypothetical protein